VDTYDLDDVRGTDDPGRAVGRRSRRTWWWSIAVVLLLVIAAAGFVREEQARGREFDALLAQVTQAQSAVQYSDARLAAIVQYTSPQLLSARAPARVRASLAALVQQAAAGRVAPMQAQRNRVATRSTGRWHPVDGRARDAYLAYLDDRIAFLKAAADDLDVLFKPQPNGPRLRAAARKALLAASPDRAATQRIRALLP
jgi:hypothetical protein